MEDWFPVPPPVASRFWRKRKATAKAKVLQSKKEVKTQLKFIEKITLQKSFIEGESIPCVPLEYQKTLQCTNCLVSLGALVSAGQEICEQNYKSSSLILAKGTGMETYNTQTLATAESGQIIKIDTDKITLRRAHCYLVYKGGYLSVVNSEYIKKGTALLSLKYEKLLTGDIVQGLGKIEELLESPKLSLNLSFKICLRRYLTKVSLDKAIQWSYAELQERLVQSVQQVYVDQGCFISDKHLEIIVRQATSLATILFPGDTGFLHHEVLPIDKIEKINKQIVSQSTLATAYSGAKLNVHLIFDSDEIPKVNRTFRARENEKGVPKTQRQKAIYYPHLKGITWGSLNSDSILSAASFQETRRVLRDNLVTDKVDFLKGIKERIILGELLEMGTGFFKNHF